MLYQNPQIKTQSLKLLLHRSEEVDVEHAKNIQNLDMSSMYWYQLY